MDRKKDNIIMLKAQNKAQIEKLKENEHKPPITTQDLDECIKEMKIELWELQEELDEHDRSLDRIEKIRRELADVLNHGGAAVVACDRLIKDMKIEKIR